jgi:hypothetical protein
MSTVGGNLKSRRAAVPESTELDLLKRGAPGRVDASQPPTPAKKPGGMTRSPEGRTMTSRNTDPAIALYSGNATNGSADMSIDRRKFSSLKRGCRHTVIVTAVGSVKLCGSVA